MRLIFSATTVLGLMAGPALAVVVGFSDKASFDAAVASATGMSLEEFDVAYEAPNDNQQFASGLIVTADFLSDSFRVQSYSGNNRLEARVDGPKGHNWSFATGVNAFGFEIYNAGPDGRDVEGEELRITVDDGSGPQSFILSELAGGLNGYVGFIGAAPFQSVRFDAEDIATIGGKEIRDRYQVDNVVMYDGVVLPKTGAEVPIGATAPLLIGGLGVFGLLRRRVARRG
ncbi:VPLPA-CTERM sorting domain-containing protein [Pseudooceanicola sp.]|uniref:VPLPA-CTERM sorting domain-containing protein n=1 Tax=Pseudooceanicola sp. TaxID=1914328 RepID=UPI0035C73F11